MIKFFALAFTLCLLTPIDSFSIQSGNACRSRIPSLLRASSSKSSPYYSIETSLTGPGNNPVHTLTFHSLPHSETDEVQHASNDDEVIHPLQSAISNTQAIVIETGKIGRQAAGAVTLTRGDTVLYATAAREKDAKESLDFVPLSVDYQERFSSAGLTSGSFHKRDGRPAEHEILTARLMDRPLRPLIAPSWRHETQLLAWVLSYDGVRSCDTLAVVAASTAMYLSDIPLLKPVAAVQVGMMEMEATSDASGKGYKFILNPTMEQMESSRLNLVIAGTEEDVLMIEGAADFLPEEVFLEAIEFGQDVIRVLCQGIQEFADVVGTEPKTMQSSDDLSQTLANIQQRVNEVMTEQVDAMYSTDGDKAAKGQLMSECYASVIEILADEFPGQEVAIKSALKELLSRRMYYRAKKEGLRCDNRQLDQIRDLYIEAGLLPRVHGSALFTRGETQTIATTTLGDAGMRQKIDKIDGMTEKRFYLQYTFPPSCVGETGRVGAPGRREVGHGNLAERALIPTLPSEAEFPYTIRLESLITESHGSSSMASVCGGCLSLMDAGVPIKRPVAGIAMGMLLDHKDSSSDEGIILSDISGTEDALGMMDFKVAGDRDGITTFQLDIKCEGLTLSTMQRALEQARVGRLHLLDEMEKALPATRDQLPSTVPKMATFFIAPDCVGKLIGPGGKQIRAVIEDFSLVNLDVNDVGRVQMSSFDSSKLTEAEEFVKKLVEAKGGPKEKKERAAYQGPPPVEGEIYTGKITGIHAFGVFVEILPGAEDGSYPGLEGLCHVSELAKDRVRNCEAYIKSMGVEELTVKYIGTTKGKVQLSRRATFDDRSGSSRGQEGDAPPNGAQGKMSDDEAAIIAKAIEKVAEL
ncbi:hypothetical protein MPSEU_000314700 [Mayamaea pseudoterrestris]|nr:hypothetical protein MPSEU_000314700 [Mayamaea pseudoterrestris]